MFDLLTWAEMVVDWSSGAGLVLVVLVWELMQYRREPVQCVSQCTEKSCFANLQGVFRI